LANPLADGVLSRPEPLRNTLRHDRDVRQTLAFGVRESSPPPDGQPRRVEILGPDEILAHPRIRRNLLFRLSFSHEPGHENVGPEERWNRDRRRLFDTGNGAEPAH